MTFLRGIFGVTVLIFLTSTTEASLLSTLCPNDISTTGAGSLKEFCSRVECEPITCDNTLLEFKAGPCSCCSVCVRFAGLKESCTGDLYPDDITIINDKTGLYTCNRNVDMTDICARYLKCTINNVCAFEDSTCTDKKNDYENSHESWSWKPECDEKGKFKPKQCKGNKCFCRAEDNRRLFGTAYKEDSEEQLMNCACSIMEVKLLDQGVANGQFAHVVCEKNGNYMPLQCLRNLCFCVNATSGEVDGIILPKELISKLHCYDADKYSKIYEQPCQQQRLNEETLAMYYHNKGFDLAQMSISNCEPGGGYLAKQCAAGNCYCVDTDGNRIASFNEEIGKAMSMTCNCARDVWEAQAGGGTTHDVQCLPNGDYKPRQCNSNNCYCVDTDGQQIGDYKDPTELTDEDCENAQGSVRLAEVAY